MKHNAESETACVRDYTEANVELINRVAGDGCPNVRCEYSEFPRCGKHFCIRPRCVRNHIANEAKTKGQ